MLLIIIDEPDSQTRTRMEIVYFVTYVRHGKVDEQIENEIPISVSLRESVEIALKTSRVSFNIYVSTSIKSVEIETIEVL